MATSSTTADTSTSADASASEDAMAPTFDWWNAVMQALAQVQEVQINAWLSWQRAVFDLYEELWDEWVSHWGGGVPIDG